MDFNSCTDTDLHISIAEADLSSKHTNMNELLPGFLHSSLCFVKWRCGALWFQWNPDGPVNLCGWPWKRSKHTRRRLVSPADNLLQSQIKDTLEFSGCGAGFFFSISSSDKEQFLFLNFNFHLTFSLRPPWDYDSEFSFPASEMSYYHFD